MGILGLCVLGLFLFFFNKCTVHHSTVNVMTCYNTKWNETCLYFLDKSGCIGCVLLYLCLVFMNLVNLCVWKIDLSHGFYITYTIIISHKYFVSYLEYLVSTPTYTFW